MKTYELYAKSENISQNIFPRDETTLCFTKYISFLTGETKIVHNKHFKHFTQ